MKDKQLERNIQKLEAFLETWKQFNQFLQRAFRGETFSDEDEEQFLELKSTIAQEYETLLMSLGGEVEREEKALRILMDAPSLRSLRDSSEGMARRVEADWHAMFIKLQSALGRLKGRRIQLASISTAGVVSGRILRNPIVILFLIVVLGFAVVQVCKELGIFKPRISMESEQPRQP